MKSPKVAIIMGSDSDLPVMQAAADLLGEMQIDFEMSIVSAHRTPQRLYDYATSAQPRGIKVVVAGAGGAAHLPGMVAAITALPVIGVPIKSSALNGEDALFSIVQMPPGVPVATVAINGGLNAGLLAAQMLGIADAKILNKVVQYKKDLAQQVLVKAEKLRTKNLPRS